MSAKDIKAKLKDIPDNAEMFVQLADVWLKIDSIVLLKNPDAPEQNAAKIVVSSANWPLFS